MKAVFSSQPLQSRAVPTLHAQQASKHASNVTLLSKLFILVSAVGKTSAHRPRQLNSPRNLISPTLVKSVPIEAYDPKNTTYKDLVDYADMQTVFAGPAGALAVKLESDDGPQSLFLPYCSGALVADNLVLTAGHCDLQNENASFNLFANRPIVFLNCYQEALSEGGKGNSSEGFLRDCYSFDVIDRYSLFEYKDRGGDVTITHDHALLTLESGDAGKLFGTLGLNLSGDLPKMSNHHASGAPLHFSPLVGLGPYNQESSDGSNAKFITVRGDLAPGSSGSAHVDEHGRVTSVTSWGAQACFEGRSEASHKPSVDDLILISRNVRGLQEEGDIEEHCNTIPEVEHALIDDVNCFVGGQQMKNIYDSLPTEFKTILENNSDHTPGDWDFGKYSQYMMDCVCNGFDFDSGDFPTAWPSGSSAPSLDLSTPPSDEPSVYPSPKPTSWTQPSPKQSSPPSSKPTKKKGKEDVNIFAIIASTLGSAAALGVLYYLYKNREAAPCNSSAHPSEEVDV